MTCAPSLSSIALSARATSGVISGWPATIDFGPTDCGGAAPAQRAFQLVNAGGVDAHLTSVALGGAPGFTTNAAVGRAIFANGGALDVIVGAPPVAAASSPAPISATLSITTDADPSPHDVTLMEEPNGAILALDTSASPDFGSFGQAPVLGSASQSFAIVNSGTGATEVTIDASPSVFGVSTPEVALAGGASQAERVTFAPTTGGATTGSLSIAATGPLCAPLPAPVPLAGTSGALPSVTPTSLAFGATCGGGAPAAQTFTITNGGDGDMTWSMDAIAGPGASQYSATASPPPGALAPGASAVVTVRAAAVASPAPSLAPSDYDAQIAITTDVPLDPAHVVTLHETPLGDVVTFASTGPLRFGQVPVGTTLAQPIAVASHANAGSPAPSIACRARRGGERVLGRVLGERRSIVFAPSSAVTYDATLAIATGDALCAPLPAPIAIEGTGTRGQVALSAATLAFGTDPNDALGLVDCGKAGLPRTLVVSNVGNQSFDVTALTLAAGSSSPYAVAAPALPIAVPIGGSASIEITPSSIPSSVANPNDATPFGDVLAVTTDAAGDAPHDVRLVMQARGAVIASTPLATTWTFDGVPAGAIGTVTTAIRNTGNAAASASLDGLLQPSIFGLRSAPTIVPAGSVTSIVAQFAPPWSDGTWSDVGTLNVRAAEALCAPIPDAWAGATIHLAGSSYSTR